MKVIKPQKLGVLHRVFESDDRFYFVVTVLAYFPTPSPRSLLPEVTLWPFLGKELGEGTVFDEGMSKAHGEVLVHGKCFPPGGPRAATYVRVALGSVDKKLAVVGDRVWKKGVPTEPEPFTEMPIDWAHAFGGPAFPQNPLGKGHAPLLVDGVEVHALPNVELDGKLVTSPRERPQPAGFGPYDLTLPQRFSKVGTYDEEWLRTRFPGVAKDMDPSFFNTAPEDQRIEGYFRGDEGFAIEHMHEEHARLEGRLPGLVTRAFITHRTDEGEVWKEVRTRLETVHLFPNAERGVLIHRGIVEVAEDDAGDVVHLLVAAEDPTAPRAVEHYEKVLAGRLDKKKGALLSLSDRDLMPAPAEGWASTNEKTDVARMIEGEGLLRKNLKRRGELMRAHGRELLEARGLDPALYGAGEPAEEEEPPGPDDVDGLFVYVEKQKARAADAQREMAAKKEELEKKARSSYAEMGLDYDKVQEEALKSGGGPPDFSADAQLKRLRDLLTIARDGGAPLEEMEAQVAHPGYIAALREQEESVTASYRRFAHYYPAASLDPDRAALLRVQAVAARDADVGLRGRDFTGADLSDLDLSGMNLAGCFLEGANLKGTNLVGADLTGAVLARADLNRTDFTRAKLRGANLGATKAQDADFSESDLREAIFGKAELDRARFRGATMKGAKFFQANLGAADLSGAIAHEILFLQVDLSLVRFAGADLTKSRFLEVTLTGVDMSQANLSGVQFITAKADGAVLRGAKLDGAVFAHDSTAIGADFSGASMVGTNLRKTRLQGAKLGGAVLDGADLSECDLRGADLYRVVARSAMFMKTNLSGARIVGANLMGAVLLRADLRGTDLTGAHLFRADLCRVDVDGETKLEDAITTQARIVPRKRPHESR